MGDQLATAEGLSNAFDEAAKSSEKFNKSIKSIGLKGILGKGLKLGASFAGNLIAAFAGEALFAAAVKGIGFLADAMDNAIVTSEEAQEKLGSMSDSYSRGQDELASLNAELETTSTRLDELSVKGNLTFTEEAELVRLQAQNDELERSIELKKAQQKIDAKKLVDQAREAYTKRTHEDVLFGEGVDFSYDKNKIENFRTDAKATYGSKDRINKIKHNATASWWDQDFSVEDYRDLSTYGNNINMLIGTYQGLRESASEINDEIIKLTESDMTKDQEKEAKALEAELDLMEEQKTSLLEQINNYAYDLSTVYSSLLAGKEAGILSEKDALMMAEIASVLDGIEHSTGSDRKTLTGSINTLFAKADFEGVKDQLVSAGQEGGAALDNLISKIPGLSSALDEAGISANDLKRYIMAIADPDALKIDKALEQLKEDFTDIDAVGMDDKKFEKKVKKRGKIIDKFLSDKSDEEIEIFYKYVKDSDLDLSELTEKDLRYNFNIALQGANSVSEDLYDITTQIESITTLVSSIDKINSILSETQTGKSLDIESFNSTELMDYRNALEYVNGSMQINAEMANAITQAILSLSIIHLLQISGFLTVISMKRNSLDYKTHTHTTIIISKQRNT